MKSNKKYGVFIPTWHTLESFCKKHDLEVEIIKCENCGKDLETTNFYYCEGWACVEVPRCVCGVLSLEGYMKPIL